MHEVNFTGYLKMEDRPTVMSGVGDTKSVPCAPGAAVTCALSLSHW